MPRKITDEQVEAVVTRVLTEKGPDMTATDPECIAKIRDVVGLYLNPPEHAPLLAVDEKSQLQALDRTAPATHKTAAIRKWPLKHPRFHHRTRASGRLPLTCVSMSYDMFVQGFDGGGAAPMPSSVFDVFRPHVDRIQPEHHFWHVRTPDDGEADIYADVTPETFDSLMISRFSEGGPLDLLAEFAIRASAVILAPGGPAMLTAEAQREDLPDDFQRDAIVVRNGDDIRQVLATF